MGKFKQAIQVGRNVTDIIALPCIKSVFKYPINDAHNSFPLRGHYPEKDDLVYCFRQGMIDDFALSGDWLCEDYNGVWAVLSDKEYQEQR